MPWMLAPKPSPVKVTTHHKSEILHQWKVRDVTWKRRLQNLKHVCKKHRPTYCVCFHRSCWKNVPSLNWIIFPNLLRLKKNFRLSRSAPTGWVSSQPGLTETMSSNKQIARHRGWQWKNQPIRIDFRDRASNGTYTTSKQIWIAKEILQYSHQMSDWMIVWSVLR